MNVKCPKCGESLTEKDRMGTTTFTCPKCGGVAKSDSEGQEGGPTRGPSDPPPAPEAKLVEKGKKPYRTHLISILAGVVGGVCVYQARGILGFVLGFVVAAAIAESIHKMVTRKKK